VHVAVSPPVQVHAEHVERMRPLQLSSSLLHEAPARALRIRVTRAKGRAMRSARSRGVIVIV
jgi:hypothetical protein